MVRDPARDQLQLLWRIAGMAIMMSAEAAAGALIGWLVDTWAGTHPRWMTIGAGVGIVIGMTSFITAAFKLSHRQSPSNTRSTGTRRDSSHHHPHH